MISDRELALARAVLQLADTASMPDTAWQRDSRVRLAREVLGVPANGRYDFAHKWAMESNSQ
jgi:hypothetical protein